MKRNLTYCLLALLLLLALAASGGSSSNAAGVAENAAPEVAASSGDPAAGEAQFNQLCIACHGAGGAGIENLGKPFTTSDFIKSKTDEELLAFVKTGRPMGDPLNTTGIDMPPKGGNPALTDEQILDIIAYIRTLQP